MQRMLAIWLPNWPIQRLVNESPELRGRPLLLAETFAGRSSVAACSREAQRLGIHPGMPLAEASALAPRRLQIKPHDPLADWQSLAQLAHWCRRFSPTVGLEASDPPRTLLFDAAGLASLHGSEQSLLDRAAREMARRGFRVRLALADTIGAAYAVARYGNMANIHGRQIIPSGVSRQALAPLPLAALRLPDSLIATLAALGFECVGDVLQLPREQLPSRFGRQLLLRIDQALGAAPEAIVSVKQSPEFAVRQSFEFPLVRQDVLRRALLTLLEKLAHALLVHRAGVLRLKCLIECESEIVAFDVGVLQATASAATFAELIDLQLERTRLTRPATAIALEVLQHAPLAQRQTLFFKAQHDFSSSPALAALVNRLASRLGRDAVVRCRLRHDAQPELAYRLERVLDGLPARHKGNVKRLPFGPLDRPLDLLKAPTLLNATIDAVSGLPQQFSWEGRRHVVNQVWGPERIDTGWWRRRRVGRDYYRLETAAGQRIWSYRRREDGRWFLHGFF